MLQKFENFISKNNLFNKQQSLLLALSGGADSVCLFHLLHQGRFNFSVAHCNFQLRGSESDADELFVTALAEAHNVKIHIKKFDTAELSSIHKIGIQELARDLRYNWFKELMVIHDYDCLLTAHHQTDNVETMLLNIMRGTGIKGLHGIPINEHAICRPLMFTKREEIMNYLSSNKLEFREDSSNATDYYLRNQIRHQVLPNLSHIQPELEQRFYETSQKIKGFELLGFELMEEVWKQTTHSIDGQLRIEMPALEKLKNKALFLFYNLQQFGFTLLQMEEILNASQVGKRVMSDGYELIMERTFLMLQRIEIKDNPSTVRIEGHNQTISVNGQSIEVRIYNSNFKPDYTLKDTLFINADQLNFPLTLRQWQDGDRLRPLGMKGSKKVSDILTDKKVDSNQRTAFMVLQQYENEIIALLPLVVSENYKIDTATSTILSITLNMA